jgi:hypothetical protein
VFDMGQTTMGNLPKGFFEPTDEALVRADEMVAEFEGALDGRLKAWFSIRVPVAMSDDLLGRLGKLALMSHVKLKSRHSPSSPRVR